MEAVVDPGEVILDEVARLRARIARDKALLVSQTAGILNPYTATIREAACAR